MRARVRATRPVPPPRRLVPPPRRPAPPLGVSVDHSGSTQIAWGQCRLLRVGIDH